MQIVDKVLKEANRTEGGLILRIYQCPKCGYRKEETRKTPPLGKPPGSSGTVGGGGGPFIGGIGRSSGGGGSLPGPRGFGGGRSGGGGAGRRW